jgi:hypothetical protein
MPATRLVSLFLFSILLATSASDCALANRYPGSEVFGRTNKDGRRGGTLQETSRLAEGPSEDSKEKEEQDRSPSSEERAIIAPNLSTLNKLPKDSLFARVHFALGRALATLYLW